MNLLYLLVVVVVAGGAAAYYFYSKKKGGSPLAKPMQAPQTPQAPSVQESEPSMSPEQELVE